MKIGISGQYGEPKASSIFWPIQKKYNEIFEQVIVNEYFENIKIFSINFRVSGAFQSFNSSGPERLKYIKNHSEITIDFVFPIESWKEVPKKVVLTNVANGVQQCLKDMIAKAFEMQEIRDEKLLITDIDKAEKIFLNSIN